MHHIWHQISMVNLPSIVKNRGLRPPVSRWHLHHPWVPQKTATYRHLQLLAPSRELRTFTCPCICGLYGADEHVVSFHAVQYWTLRLNVCNVFPWISWTLKMSIKEPSPVLWIASSHTHPGDGWISHSSATWSLRTMEMTGNWSGRTIWENRLYFDSKQNCSTNMKSLLGIHVQPINDGFCYDLKYDRWISLSL